MLYLLACLHCDCLDDAWVIPFASDQERELWHRAHVKGAGHTWYWVDDGVPLSASVANAQVREYMARFRNFAPPTIPRRAS